MGLPALWAMSTSLGATSIMHGHTWPSPPFPLSNRPKRFPFTEGGGCGRRSWVHGLPLPILVVLAIFLLLDTLVSLGERASSPQIWSLRDVGVELA